MSNSYLTTETTSFESDINSGDNAKVHSAQALITQHTTTLGGLVAIAKMKQEDLVQMDPRFGKYDEVLLNKAAFQLFSESCKKIDPKLDSYTLWLQNVISRKVSVTQNPLGITPKINVKEYA